jgi:hypothetical protein
MIYFDRAYIQQRYDHGSLIVVGFLFAATAVFAQERNEIVLPEFSYPGYEAELEENDWRNKTDTDDNEWRAEEQLPESKSRIKYGYDPSYEEAQEKYNDQFNNLNQRLNSSDETIAPSQIQFDW